MQEASLVNQNRIHLGYHYPRSPQTAREAIAGLKSFGAMFGPAIVSDFTKYYAISRDFSMTTVDEFVDFCDQVGLSLETQWPPDGVLDHTTVHACWAVPETIFDYHHLRQIVTERLSSQSGFTLLRRCRPTRVELGPPHRVTLSDGRTLRCDVLVNAAYAGIAEVLALIDCPPPSIQFELCVMPIMEIDDPPPRFGVTLMDGPFCSLMPKGRDAGRFIVYHVDRSVVQRQVDDRHPEWQPLEGLVEQEIVRASLEYFPILERMRVRESWIGTRVVLAA